jgi:hypothetical protein
MKDSKNSNTKLDNYYELTEKDFYPPEDTRIYCSGIEDINGGDNFDDYIQSFYEEYADELFDD